MGASHPRESFCRGEQVVEDRVILFGSCEKTGLFQAALILSYRRNGWLLGPNQGLFRTDIRSAIMFSDKVVVRGRAGCVVNVLRARPPRSERRCSGSRTDSAERNDVGGDREVQNVAQRGRGRSATNGRRHQHAGELRERSVGGRGFDTVRIPAAAAIGILAASALDGDGGHVAHRRAVVGLVCKGVAAGERLTGGVSKRTVPDAAA